MGFRYLVSAVVVVIISLVCRPCDCMFIHDLLRSNGLPAGLLPKEVKSYTLSEETGRLEVFLERPCLAKLDTSMAFYERVVRANLSFGRLAGVEGFSQEELFLWLPVKDILVDDPTSGLIVFDIGLAYKHLSFSLFEDPPHCNPLPPPQSVSTIGSWIPWFEASFYLDV